MREQRDISPGAVGERGGVFLCLVLSYMSQPSLAQMLVLFCERLWLLRVRPVCIWTVLVLGPSPLSRCGGGENKLALLNGNTRKALVGLMNTPPGPPVTMAPTPDWWLSRSWGADWKQGKGSGTVAYARHPPPRRSRGDWTRRGVGKEERKEMWGECDLL